MENPVMILGASALGMVALDTFQSNGVIVYGFLDDDPKLHKTEIGGVTVLGSTDDEGYTKLIGKKCEAFVAVDDPKYRKSLVEMLNEERHVMPVNAIHATAVVSATATFGHGNLIGPGVVINTKARVGSHVLLHAKALVDYGAEVGDFVQVGAGSIIGAGSRIEDGAFIGAGAVVVAGITVGKNARVGAGSVVIEAVAARATVFGNPAKGV
ncbi:MAG: NeuD/PglB/VioB family sugar acetyltransferase [Ferruginibacter sp.]|nr:NeuD/PglB/VioB family sugar acetyltransferase [Cytophagales bacterium]